MAEMSLNEFNEGVNNLFDNLQHLGQALQALSEKMQETERSFDLTDNVQPAQTGANTQAVQTEPAKPMQDAVQNNAATVTPANNQEAANNQAAIDLVNNIDVNDLGDFSAQAEPVQSAATMQTAQTNSAAQDAANNIDIDSLLNSVSTDQNKSAGLGV